MVASSSFINAPRRFVLRTTDRPIDRLQQRVAGVCCASTQGRCRCVLEIVTRQATDTNVKQQQVTVQQERKRERERKNGTWTPSTGAKKGVAGISDLAADQRLDSATTPCGFLLLFLQFPHRFKKHDRPHLISTVGLPTVRPFRLCSLFCPAHSEQRVSLLLYYSINTTCTSMFAN